MVNIERAKKFDELGNNAITVINEMCEIAFKEPSISGYTYTTICNLRNEITELIARYEIDLHYITKK
jgi:hypothetical protein